MINYTIGNLLDCPQKILVHGCNNYGVMGSGVAKQIRDRWPNVFDTYKLTYDVFGLELGSIIPVETPDNKVVVNAITQDGFGRDGRVYVDYNAIEKCFVQINEQVKIWEVAEVSYPFIGAGLGGGNWTIIEEILVRTATNYTPVVYSFDGKYPDGKPLKI
jgi:O-acetyl-ADP-ribose deacetylase (regulator of RNase III)